MSALITAPEGLVNLIILDLLAKIKEVFEMDQTLLMELSDIQVDLERGIHTIAVIADGLCFYTSHNALSGQQTEAYIEVLNAVEDALSEVSKRLQSMAERADVPNEKGSAA